MASDAITLALVKEFLSYDPETGHFTWLKVTTNKVSPGERAGTLGKRGYIEIGLLTQRFKAHRLAWFFMKGTWPSTQIDHVDRVRTNNRWENLREATNAENGQNASDRKNNTSGVRGVNWDKKRLLWVAKICVMRKQHYLGAFDDLAEAEDAYRKAQQLYHPTFVEVPASSSSR